MLFRSGWKYHRVGEESPARCFYCGELFAEMDHAPPISLAEKYSGIGWKFFFLVPSCRECNHLLKNVDIPTIDKRMEFLAQKYERRYSKFLNQPEWTNREIARVGKNMRKYIRRCIETKGAVERRIEYLRAAQRRAMHLYVGGDGLA